MITAQTYVDSIISFSDEIDSQSDSSSEPDFGFAFKSEETSSLDSNDIVLTFLRPRYNVFEGDKQEDSVGQTAVLTSSSVAVLLAKNLEFVLKSQEVKDFYKQINAATDYFGSAGIIGFLSCINRVAVADFDNQLTRMALLIMQFDLLNLSSFESADDLVAGRYIYEFSLIFEKYDKNYLFDIYLNLRSLVLETFIEKYPFNKCSSVKYTSFADLDNRLRNSAEINANINNEIFENLAKLSINDNVISNLKTVGYVGKTFVNDKYAYDWKFEDNCDGEILGERCDQYSEELFNHFLTLDKNNSFQVDYKLHASLLNVHSTFKQITQEERLSFNSLSFFAKHYLESKKEESTTDNQIFFGHRGVMTKLIMLINDRNASSPTFRVFKYKEMLFFQPIELATKSSFSYSYQNQSSLSGFGFEHLMTKDQQTTHDEYTVHYIFNKFEINGLKFVIQAEVDAANIDEERNKLVPFEFKSISAANYNNIYSKNGLFLKSWSQNYFLDEDALTLVGVRTKKYTLKESHLHSQKSLLHSWKVYIKDNSAVMLSDEDIHKNTNEELSNIFLKVKSKMNHREMGEEEILMYEFCVKRNKETGAINCSDYNSRVFDLQNDKKYSEISDVFIKQGLRDIHKNMNQ